MLSKLKKLFTNTSYKKKNFRFSYFTNVQDCNNVSAKEYLSNSIIYKSIKLISDSASHVPLVVFSKKDRRFVKDKIHFANQLLRNPNPLQGGAEFFTEIITNKLLFGESYIMMLTSPIDSKKVELYIINNQDISPVIEGGMITKYLHHQNEVKKIYEIDPVTKKSRILFLKNYNPINPLRGVSCLQPAKNAINLYKQSMQWNNALLKNGARPSGAIILKDSSKYLSQEEFMRLKQQIDEKYSSAQNVGRPMLLEGGLDWKEMSMTPKDMDFAESKDSAAREIALACGIPPQLLGIKGDSTYNNMKEARIALWEETIIPLLDKISDCFSNWLSYWFEEELIIDFDREAISAITHKRDILWDKLTKVDFMTINEKREFLGLPPLDSINELSKITQE